MKKKLLLTIATLLAGFTTTFAQPGSLDLTFDPGTGADGGVYTTAIQPDGKIIIGGIFTEYNGTGRNYIARLNTDGSLDLSFNPGMGANGEVFSTVIQPDGKIIIAGNFYEYNGTGRNRIARLNADGSLDATFNPGTGADYTINATLIQPDGKIIIGGGFFNYNGTGINKIARLNSNGSLDMTFDPGTGASSTVATTTIQPDGKIIIGGYFYDYNGTGRNRIARLNADGSLDTSFNPGMGANDWVATTTIQPDGKIIIGGWFTEYNSTVINRIARLNTDGSLDTSFNLGTGANGDISTTAIQPDGKIIIGGGFFNYNGMGRNRIARLNADGSLDTSFNPGMGANGQVFTTSIQTNGKIIIGGNFLNYNGTGRYRIARINEEGTLGTVELAQKGSVSIYPNPFSSQSVLQTDNVLNNATLTLTNVFGQTVAQINYISGHTVLLKRNDLPAGLYFVRLTEGNKLITEGKIIIVN